MITTEQIQIIVTEMERRWRKRTPPKSMYDALPGYRVVRSEMHSFGLENGIDVPLPGQDDDYDRAVMQLFDRLRKEFPDEKWDKPNAIERQRRKELGLR